MKAQSLAYDLRVKVGNKEMTQEVAIQQLNDKFFDGMNRGMALTVYNQFVWRDRVGKYRIFREIAKATGGEKFDESATKYPATLFKDFDRNIIDAGRNARNEALRQEAAFGRTGFDRHDDGHGNVTITPIDETS